MTKPGPRDIAHMGNVELFTDKFDESYWFFNDLLAMREFARAGDSVFLRTWDDYENWSIKLTPRDRSGVGEVQYRASSPEALDRLVASIEASGRGLGWGEGEHGVGRVYRFTDPDSHPQALYYDTEWYQATDDKPALKNQASRFPGHGVNARRLDHINYLGASVEDNAAFARDVLGLEDTELIQLDNGKIAAHWFHFQNKSYDLVYSADHTGSHGRLHHIAFAPDTREDILKAADIFLENGIHIESGPHKHAINQTFFLYVWEPGGNRIEFANAGARLILAPDWKPVVWTEEERKKGQAWGMQTIETFHTHGTPPAGKG
ncbi:VOC family protein [Pseudolysinimonas yzui]|uniref:Catechol 2,3-dioxygenase n=1 Tax=Pseudolysinimonas yzui TaxID=2708254 RepID=A0A8J3E0X3_9MICO|nr:VOC family protein [Pseudolysinimonas yzui]GHF04631.1 catechol 2,3-dioxygenase [Pseudolysinimonas yzui]